MTHDYGDSDYDRTDWDVGDEKTFTADIILQQVIVTKTFTAENSKVQVFWLLIHSLTSRGT